MDNRCTSENIERYSRQLLLQGWSFKKQESLRNLDLYIDLTSPALLLYGAALGIEKFYLSKNCNYGTEIIKFLFRFNSGIKLEYPKTKTSYDIIITESSGENINIPSKYTYLITNKNTRSTKVTREDSKGEKSDIYEAPDGLKHIDLSWQTGTAIILDISRLL